jgi:hypothetical protein
MLNFDEMIERIENNSKFTPVEVVAAMDAIASAGNVLTKKQAKRWGDQLERLKWHGGYSNFIDDPSQALRDNPGFLADMLMWAGWEAVQKSRGNRRDFDVVVDDTLKRDRAHK